MESNISGNEKLLCIPEVCTPSVQRDSQEIHKDVPFLRTYPCVWLKWMHNKDIQKL